MIKWNQPTWCSNFLNRNFELFWHWSNNTENHKSSEYTCTTVDERNCDRVSVRNGNCDLLYHIGQLLKSNHLNLIQSCNLNMKQERNHQLKAAKVQNEAPSPNQRQFVTGTKTAIRKHRHTWGSYCGICYNFPSLWGSRIQHQVNRKSA